MAKQEQVEKSGVTFPSVEEARAAKPEKHAKWKLWSVTCPDGQSCYVWADGIGHALRQVAIKDGYSTTCLDRKPVNPALVSGMLAALSAEDRAAILAQYVGKKGK
jgi:hypothetical protein